MNQCTQSHPLGLGPGPGALRVNPAGDIHTRYFRVVGHSGYITPGTHKIQNFSVGPRAPRVNHARYIHTRYFGVGPRSQWPLGLYHARDTHDSVLWGCA